jgi:hypothetical protein
MKSALQLCTLYSVRRFKVSAAVMRKSFYGLKVGEFLHNSSSKLLSLLTLRLRKTQLRSMKIIHPNKVTGQLLDIIQEAEKELVIVSPYVNFSYWQKPVTAIKQAIARGVKVDFYIRNDPGRDTGQTHVEKLGITPILVDNLHAKIYYNDTNGIITSMNLLHSSDSNSIEIGSQVETPAELAELRRIVHQFLAHYKPAEVPALASPVSPPSSAPSMPFDEYLGMHLFHTIDRDAYVEWENDTQLSISALRNSFSLSVAQPNNKVVLEGVISQREGNRYTSHGPRHFTTATMLYKLVPGDQNNYTRIRATYTRLLSSPNLDQLADQETEALVTATTDFIHAVRAFKDDYR